MKKLIHIICLIAFSIIISSCNNNNAFKPRVDKYCVGAWETERGDTINRTDCDGKKQGIWITLPRHRVNDTTTRIDTSYYKDGILIK